MRWNMMMFNRLWFSICTVLQTGSAQNVFFSPVLEFSAFCILIPTFEGKSQ